MPRRAFLERLPRGIAGRLRESRQRVELADDDQHGFPASVRGGEPCGHAGNTLLHVEARAGECLLEQRSALLFLVSQLCELPDLARDGDVLILSAVDVLQKSGGAVRALLGGLRSDGSDDHGTSDDERCSSHDADSISRRM
jgi:hypothetical protein